MIAVLIIVALLILLLQDYLFIQWTPRGLEYTCEFDRSQAVEGERIHMVETVRNRRPLPILWLVADIHTSPRLDYGGEWNHVSLDSQRVTSLYTLGGRTGVKRTWNVTCLKRGVIHIKYVTLIWGGLLGYRLGTRAQSCDVWLTVYPGVVDIDDAFTPKNLVQSDVSVRRFIVDDLFLYSGIREYRHNDPMNRVHWGATARQGTLMSRQNDFTSEMTVLIALNIQSTEFERRESCDPERSELAIKVAASVAEKAVRRGAMCALATNASLNDGEQSITLTQPATGQAGLLAINDVLARLSCVNRREFADFLDELAATRRDLEVVVVSVYLSDRVSERCETLRAAGNSVKVMLINSHADTSTTEHSFPVWTLRGD